MIRVLRTEEILAPAYHEAGHAVAAHALGRPLHELSTAPEEETVGTCAYALWGEETHAAADGDAQAAAAEAVVALAGPVAEEVATGTLHEEFSEADLVLAEELAEAAAGPEGVDPYLDRVQEEAEALLSARWPAVEALAAALAARGRIEPEAARVLIEEALAGGGAG